MRLSIVSNKSVISEYIMTTFRFFKQDLGVVVFVLNTTPLQYASETLDARVV